MTNIADILRNSPEGLKLYSSAFGDCKLSYVIEDEITIEYFDGKNPDYITLDQYGRFKEDGGCVLFPSNFLQTWVAWQEILFRDEMAIGIVVVDNMGGLFILIKNDKDNKIKVANSNGEEFVIESRDVDKYRFATIEDSTDFFSKVGKNNCYWSDVEKTIIKNTHCYEPKYDTKEEPKELPYSDAEAKEFADKVSHEWWQMAMNEWNTLTEDEKKKYNQYIGFNDFSDHLMNILRSVLLGLKRNGKLIYEEGSLFSEPDQKPAEIEMNETTVPCYEPKYSSCEKFSIDDFKPFDKVLWRLGDNDTWAIGFFDNYYIAGENDKVNYSVVGYEKDYVSQCVPYNDETKYLHDTDQEYNGKYKTW